MVFEEWAALTAIGKPNITKGKMKRIGLVIALACILYPYSVA